MRLISYVLWLSGIIGQSSVCPLKFTYDYTLLGYKVVWCIALMNTGPQTHSGVSFGFTVICFFFVCLPTRYTTVSHWPWAFFQQEQSAKPLLKDGPMCLLNIPNMRRYTDCVNNALIFRAKECVCVFVRVCVSMYILLCLSMASVALHITDTCRCYMQHGETSVWFTADKS